MQLHASYNKYDLITENAMMQLKLLFNLSVDLRLQLRAVPCPKTATFVLAHLKLNLQSVPLPFLTRFSNPVSEPQIESVDVHGSTDSLRISIFFFNVLLFLTDKRSRTAHYDFKLYIRSVCS